MKAEFESVKAASQIAIELASGVSRGVARRPNLLVRAGRKVKSFFQMAKIVEKEAQAIVEESCDVDDPQLCTDDNLFKVAVGELKGLILKTLRLSSGQASVQDLAGGMEVRRMSRCLANAVALLHPWPQRRRTCASSSLSEVLSDACCSLIRCDGCAAIVPRMHVSANHFMLTGWLADSFTRLCTEANPGSVGLPGAVRHQGCEGGKGERRPSGGEELRLW